MNKVCITGNLTRDPELRATQDGKSVANFNLAVNGYKDKVDFFSIVVWGTQADNCGKYLFKGSKVGITGRLQSRSYEVEGQKRTIVEIVAEEVEFLTPKEKKETELEEIAGDLPF